MGSHNYPVTRKPRTQRLRRRWTRDEAVRRLMCGIRTLAPHVDSRIYTPTLQSFARISVLLSDCYELIRRQELIGPNGELRPSVDTVRRLALTQVHLAEKLGLTPSSLREATHERTAVDMLDAAAERIEKLVGPSPYRSRARKVEDGKVAAEAVERSPAGSPDSSPD